MSRPVTCSMASLIETGTQVEEGLSSPSHSPSPSDLVNEGTQDAGIEEDLDNPAEEHEEEDSHAIRELAALRAEIQELRQRLERQAATLERSQMSASEAWHQVDLAEVKIRGLQGDLQGLQEENKDLTEDAATYREQWDEAQSSHVRAEAEWVARNKDWQQQFQALQAQAVHRGFWTEFQRHAQLQRQFEFVQNRLHSSEDGCKQAEQELLLLRRQRWPSPLHQPRNQREELI